MPESLWPAIITAATAILMFIVSKYFDARARQEEANRWQESKESEERRWYLNYLVPKKMEALSNLYSALEECNWSLLMYANGKVTRNIVGTRATPAFMNFLKSSTFAAVYFTQETSKAMDRYQDQCQSVIMSVAGQLPKVEMPDAEAVVDWGEDIRESYGKAYMAGRDCLREVLNPSTLEQIEKGRW